jgi:hypothetical protein
LPVALPPMCSRGSVHAQVDFESEGTWGSRGGCWLLPGEMKITFYLKLSYFASISRRYLQGKRTERVLGSRGWVVGCWMSVLLLRVSPFSRSHGAEPGGWLCGCLLFNFPFRSISTYIGTCGMHKWLRVPSRRIIERLISRIKCLHPCD